MLTRNQSDTYTYTFGELVVIAVKPWARHLTTWYVKCKGCGEKKMFRKLGRKMWVARCDTCALEYTVTPRDYYLRSEVDLRNIMGEEY